jgi:undecaprenyl-diphosphatase
LAARAKELDAALLRIARTRGHTPAAERAVARFSSLGEHGKLWLAIGAAAAIADPGRGRAWTGATVQVARAYVLNSLLKLVLRRRRPRLPGLPPLVGTPTGLSLPSAHATTSFAGARQYARLGLPRAPLYVLAAALSASRVYLGVHYPSDVLAGALVGTRVAGPRSGPGGGVEEAA